MVLMRSSGGAVEVSVGEMVSSGSGTAWVLLLLVLVSVWMSSSSMLLSSVVVLSASWSRTIGLLMGDLTSAMRNEGNLDRLWSRRCSCSARGGSAVDMAALKKQETQ